MTRSKKTQSASIETLEGRTLYSAAPHVVGYLPDYEYSPAIMAGLDWKALTQINYFAVAPNADDGNMPGTYGEPAVSTGIDWNTKQNYPLSQLTAVVTAAKSHNVAVDIVIGGANQDTSLQTIIDGSQTLQNDFADSVQVFCNKYGVAGVDLDWEPSNPTAEQITHYGNLIQTLRQNTTGIQLSAAVNADRVWLAPDYDSTQYVLNTTAVRNLDTINVMSYDLGNPGENAPIAKAETDLTDWGTYVTAAQTSSSQNFKGKLIFGVPFYANATTLSSSMIDPNNPWSNVTESNTSAASYAQILANAPAGAVDFSLTNTQDLQVKYLSIPGTFDGLESSATWNLDSRGTVAAKTTFALTHGFGGVMAWELGQDYFTNAGTYDTNKSLLPAIEQAVNTYTGVQTTPPPVNTGIITGKVFFDTNKDKHQGTFESGLSGWTVYLDQNNNGVLDAGEIRATTNSSGTYRFAGLAAGSYTVRVVGRATYLPTTSPQRITLATGQNVGNVLFGEFSYFRFPIY